MQRNIVYGTADFLFTYNKTPPPNLYDTEHYSVYGGSMRLSFVCGFGIVTVSHERPAL